MMLPSMQACEACSTQTTLPLLPVRLLHCCSSFHMGGAQMKAFVLLAISFITLFNKHVTYYLQEDYLQLPNKTRTFFMTAAVQFPHADWYVKVDDDIYLMPSR